MAFIEVRAASTNYSKTSRGRSHLEGQGNLLSSLRIGIAGYYMA